METNETSQSQEEFNETYFMIQSKNPNLTNCQPTILMTELQDFRQLKWWLMGMIMGPLIVFGFCGNLMSITVLLRRKMRCEAFNQLLASLCVIDTIFILCNSMSCAYALRINSPRIPILARIREILDAFAKVSLCGSVLMTVALSFERHFAIRFPNEYRIHLRITPWWKHLAYYLIPVIGISVSLNIPLFTSLDHTWMTDITYLKINLFFRIFHPIATTGIIPIILLIILNVRITLGIVSLRNRMRDWNVKSDQVVCKNRTSSYPRPNRDSDKSLGLRKISSKSDKAAQNTRREIKMAHITITIVGIFFFLNIPRVFMGAYEVSQMHLVLHCTRYNSEWHPRMWYYRLDNISRFLMVLNSSINFLIYCIKNSQFKEEFCVVFMPKCIKRNTEPTQPVSSGKPTNDDEIELSDRLPLPFNVDGEQDDI